MTQEVKRGVGGRFAKGSAPGPGRPKDDNLPPCPSGAVAVGLSDAWETLAKAARKGDTRAAIKLTEIAGKFGSTPDEGGPDARYAGVPAEVGELLGELDIGLGDILHRYRLGFCLEDVELLAVEAAEAVRRDGPKSKEASRWAGVLIREIRELESKAG